MSDSTPAPALPGSSPSILQLLKGILPDNDAWAPLGVMIYAFVQNSDLELPEFADLSGMEGLTPLLVILGLLFFFARSLVKKRFDELKRQNRGLSTQVGLLTQQVQQLMESTEGIAHEAAVRALRAHNLEATVPGFDPGEILPPADPG